MMGYIHSHMYSQILSIKITSSILIDFRNLPGKSLAIIIFFQIHVFVSMKRAYMKISLVRLSFYQLEFAIYELYCNLSQKIFFSFYDIF